MLRLVADPFLGAPVVAHVAADVADSGITADDASSRLSMVIAGLVALAVVIAISTVVFWRATRPDRSRGREVGIRWIETNEVTPVPAWSPAAAPVGPDGAAPASHTPVGTDLGAIRATPADG